LHRTDRVSCRGSRTAASDVMRRAWPDRRRRRRPCRHALRVAGVVQTAGFAGVLWGQSASGRLERHGTHAGPQAARSAARSLAPAGLAAGCSAGPVGEVHAPGCPARSERRTVSRLAAHGSGAESSGRIRSCREAVSRASPVITAASSPLPHAVPGLARQPGMATREMPSRSRRVTTTWMACPDHAPLVRFSFRRPGFRGWVHSWRAGSLCGGGRTSAARAAGEYCRGSGPLPSRPASSLARRCCRW